MAKLLLVEDDPRIVSFIERGLERRGPRARRRRHRRSPAWRWRATRDYPLMILDRMLPDMDGVEVCRQLRQERVGTRILMLTAKDALGDKIGGLQRRRRRLHDQALLLRRVRRPHRGAAAPQRAAAPRARCCASPTSCSTRRPARSRAASAPIELTPQGVRAAALPDGERRHRAQPLADPQQQLGLRLRPGHQGRRRLHPLPAQEGRRGRGRRPHPHHPRRRLLHRRPRVIRPPVDPFGPRPHVTTAPHSLRGFGGDKSARACLPPAGASSVQTGYMGDRSDRRHG